MSAFGVFLTAVGGLLVLRVLELALFSRLEKRSEVSAFSVHFFTWGIPLLKKWLIWPVVLLAGLMALRSCYTSEPPTAALETAEAALEAAAPRQFAAVKETALKALLPE